MAVDRLTIERYVLECNICFELYNDDDRQPRILPCQHTFCISCLKNTLQSDKLICSKCKAENTVSKVEDLPNDNTRRDLMDILNQQGSNTRNVCTSCDEGDVAVGYCEVCNELMCAECTKAHRRMRATSKHNVADLGPIIPKEKSDTNDAPDVRLYCYTCGKICEKCTSGHRLVSVDKGYELRLKELTELVEKIKIKVGNDCSTKDTNDALLQEKNSYLLMQEKLRSHFQDYKEILERREKMLLSQLSETHTQNEKVLNQTLEDLSSFRLQANNAMSLAEKLSTDADKKGLLDSFLSLRDEIERLSGFDCRMEGLQQLVFTEACTTDDFEKIIGAIGSLTRRSEIIAHCEVPVTEESYAETRPESIQGLIQSFSFNQSPQLMEVLKSVNMSGHLYLVSTPLPSSESRSLPPDIRQPQPSASSQSLPPGNTQNFTKCNHQPLLSDTSQPSPYSKNQPLPSEISKPLPSEISKPLPSEISKPLPSEISHPLPSEIVQPLSSSSTQNSLPSSSSFIPLHAAPESITNVNHFMAKLATANMTNGKRRILESPLYRAIVMSRFQTHRLHGDWRIDGSDVTVYANSVDEAERCLHIMDDSICEKAIAVRPETMILVNSDKWLEVERMQYTKYPNMISIDVIHDQNKVIVYSTSSTILLDVHDAVTIFFRENDLKVMLLKFNDKRVVAILLKQKNALKKILASWSHYCVGVRRLDDHTLEVKGIGVGLGQAVQCVYMLAKKCVTAVDEDERFDDNDCNEDDDEEEERFENTPPVGEVSVELRLGGIDVTTRSMSLIGDDRVVYVLHGDVTELPVEAIVNPANKNLRHDGGLAKVLVRKGGRCIQEECRDFVTQNGDLQVGDVMVSSAGTLKPRALLHTVGPKWIDGLKEEESLLEKAVFNSLTEANRRMLISVAIPAIGAGAYRFPVDTAAKCIVKAVKAFFLAKPASSLREIYLVDLSTEIVDNFTNKLKVLYADGDHVVSTFQIAPPSPIQFLIMPKPQ